jgi:hypothetical protein
MPTSKLACFSAGAEAATKYLIKSKYAWLHANSGGMMTGVCVALRDGYTLNSARDSQERRATAVWDVGVLRMRGGGLWVMFGSISAVYRSRCHGYIGDAEALHAWVSYRGALDGAAAAACRTLRGSKM